MSEFENKVNEEIKEEVKQEEIKVEHKQEEVKEPAGAEQDAPKEEPEKGEAKAETKKTASKKTTGKKATEKKAADKKETPKKEKQEKKQEEKPELPPIEFKALASSSKNTAIHSLMLQIKNNKLNLNHEVQRKGSQWKLENKVKLLESIVSGVVVNAIVVAEMDGNKFCLDGKQRLETLFSFCCDPNDARFNPKLKLFGRSYAELDDATRDLIDGANINVISYANCSEEDCFRLFEVYNNGVSLSSAQKSKSYLSVELINKINGLLNSVFIKNKCNISMGQSLKEEDLMTVIQSCMIASGFEFKSFNNKEVDRYLKETDSDFIMQTLNIIEEHIQILDGIVADKEKNLKKIHLPMILACCNDSEAFADKLRNFLENYDNEAEQEIQNYKNLYCQGSTSQKAQVEGRLAYWKNF